MSEQQPTAKLIAKHIENPDTQWSLGTFGGIAEFSRDRDEDVAIDLSDRSLSAVDRARRHSHFTVRRP